MSETFYDADQNIHKDLEDLNSPEYVIANTRVPVEADAPEAIVTAGPGRAGSTALLALLASQPDIQRGYYQPWKTLIRHGDTYGTFDIPGRPDGVDRIVAKETFGPFHPQEEFDPIDLLIQSGFPLEQVIFAPLVRDALATYKSNLTFTGGIEPDTLISNIRHTMNLFEEYTQRGIPVIPVAYDIFAEGEPAMQGLFAQLDLPFNGMEFDRQALQPVELGGQMHLGEVGDPIERQVIWDSAINKGGFKVNGDRNLQPHDFSAFVDMPGASGMSSDVLVEQAAYIQKQAGPIYTDFYAESANILGVDTSRDAFARTA